MTTLHIDLASSSMFSALRVFPLPRGELQMIAWDRRRETSPFLGIGNETTRKLKDEECHPVLQALGKGSYRVY